MFGLSSHAFDSKKLADILCQLYYSLCYLKQWIILTASVKFTSSETHNMAAQGAVRFYFIALQQNGPRYLYPGFSPVRVVVVVWYLLQYLQRKLSKCRWTKSPKSVLFIMIKSTTIWAKEPRFKSSGAGFSNILQQWTCLPERVGLVVLTSLVNIESSRYF